MAKDRREAVAGQELRVVDRDGAGTGIVMQIARPAGPRPDQDSPDHVVWLAGAVTGWNRFVVDDAECRFTAENVAALLCRFPHIRAQVQRAVDEEPRHEG